MDLMNNFDEKCLGDIAAGEPEWLRAFRISSFAAFRKLPVEQSELFKKYVDVGGVDWNSFRPDSGAGSKIPGELVPLIAPGSAVLCGPSLRAPRAGGAVLLDIKTAAAEGLCREYFEAGHENKFGAFNSAFFTSGYFLKVPDNTEAELRVATIVPESSTAAKNIIVVGRNSSLRLVEERYSTSSQLLSSATEVRAGENSSVTLSGIHALGEGAVEIASKKVTLEKNARVFASSGFFGSRLTLSATDYVMKAGSSAESYELVYGSGAQRYNVSSNLFHEGIGTSGKVVAKGVFADSSRGLLRGMINISKGAANSSAYLSDHAVLLSKDAASDAVPGLQIENNDVKATHSASVAQINEDQIFYLMSRGLAESEAKKLVVSGFLEPVMRALPQDVAHTTRALFELKWGRRSIAELKDAIHDVSDTATASKKDIFEGHYKYR